VKSEKFYQKPLSGFESHSEAENFVKAKNTKNFLIFIFSF